MGDISCATKSTYTSKDQSMLLAIGKEVVVVQTSTLFLMAGNTHFSIKTYSSLHVSPLIKLGFCRFFGLANQYIQNVRSNPLGHPLLVLSSPPSCVWWDWS
jgi:hypothetical protein